MLQVTQQLGKGFAIGSAALTALALFVSYAQAVGLEAINLLDYRVIIGIFIGGEAQRNKGYGAEAIRLVLNYGFKTMNLHSINLTVHADNFAGMSCYKKVGFREVGRLPEVLFMDGKYVDKVYMSILEHEFSSDSNNVII